MQEFTNILKKVTQTIDAVGESVFIEELDQMALKFKCSGLSKIAKVILEEFVIPYNSIIKKPTSKPNHKHYTMAKYLFLYFAQNIERKKLLEIGYTRSTVFRAVKTIDGLLPQNPEHKFIIDKKLIIESKL